MVVGGAIDNGPSRLRGQLRAVGRRWKMITLFTLLGLVLAYAYSASQPPTYRAYADILLSPTTFDVQRGGAEISSDEIVTQVQVVTSRPVAEMVQDELSLVEVPELPELVTVEVLGTARVLRITATSRDPDRAAEMATSVADQYLSYRRLNTQQSLNEVAATLTDRQQQLENRIDRLDEELADGGDGPDVDSGALEAERRNLLSQLGQITTQLAGLDIRVTAGAGGDVLRAPEIPTAPVSPQPVMSGVLGLLAGLLIGLAVAVLRNRLTEVFRDEQTVQQSLGALPILSRVPKWESRGHGGLITLAQPNSRASQAFKGLGARLRFMLDRRRGDRQGGAVVLCTSAGPAEGKTALAANLAVAAARVGTRVVLVDADFRRDGRERIPGLPSHAAGLSDLLLRDSVPDEYLVPGPVRNLQILPAGAGPADPNELLASARMESVVSALTDIADLVIVDTAPTLSYADSLEMAHVADLILLVTQMGKSRISAVEDVAERLLQVSAGSSVGAVLLDGTNRPGHRPGHRPGRPRRHRPNSATPSKRADQVQQHPSASRR